jgi:hydroxymethylpyrimidine/phosphomethylpyrimidine kinase
MSDESLKHERPLALSIAGFDPSAGAGVLADVRAMEALGVVGQAVVTGQTVQSDLWLYEVQWQMDLCLRQLDVLLDRGMFSGAKIGILPDLDALEAILDHIEAKQKGMPIVWDPVFAPTAGEVFMTNPDPVKLLTLLPRLNLITPNLHEFNRLKQACPALTRVCPVFLKGGHGESGPRDDQLIMDNEVIAFPAERVEHANKHGSGCTVAAFLTAFLASGYSLAEACRRASERMPEFMTSSKTRLGVHGPWPVPGRVLMGGNQ